MTSDLGGVVVESHTPQAARACSKHLPKDLAVLKILRSRLSFPATGVAVTGPPDRGNETIYLHRSGLLLENGPGRPENRYSRYGFPPPKKKRFIWHKRGGLYAIKVGVRMP